MRQRSFSVYFLLLLSSLKSMRFLEDRIFALKTGQGGDQDPAYIWVGNKISLLGCRLKSGLFLNVWFGTLLCLRQHSFWWFWENDNEDSDRSPWMLEWFSINSVGNDGMIPLAFSHDKTELISQIHSAVWVCCIETTSHNLTVWKSFWKPRSARNKNTKPSCNSPSLQSPDSLSVETNDTSVLTTFFWK